MSKKIDSDLLKRFYLKQCTAEEAQLVYSWLQNPENQSEISEEMEKRWEEIFGMPENYDAYQRAKLPENSSLNPKSRRLATILQSNQPSFSFYKYAAVITILLTFAAGIYFFVRQEAPTQEISVTEPVFKVKETQKGQKLQFRLSDGTFVTLNTESKLYYPQQFDSLKRLVRLEGEAYFEVAHDTYRPFQVMSDSIITTALGTVFNVYSPDSTNMVVVTLMEGKVAVDKTDNSIQQILVPGESAVYHKEAQKIEKHQFNIGELTAWKDGLLILKNAGIEEIRQRLESWYGVEIALINQPDNDWTYTGDFRNESLENVLKGISFSKNIDYDIQGKNVQIRFK